MLQNDDLLKPSALDLPEQSEDVCTPASPADGTPSEPDPDGDEELDRLRAELAELRAELASREEAMQRMNEECAEFAELYPERSLASLPDEVWQGVRAGLPLAASVAFAEAKQRRRDALAAEINDRNRAASSGGVGGNAADYFSPAEVRAMSAAEVRANYAKIMDSMKLWN